MPGDGVGNEVVPEGLKVLKEAGRKFGFTYTTTDYPFGGEYYLKTKTTLPDSALKELAASQDSNARLSEEVESLQAERLHVRNRLEKLLGHIDQLGPA